MTQEVWAKPLIGTSAGGNEFREHLQIFGWGACYPAMASAHAIAGFIYESKKMTADPSEPDL
jgi:hypothetical protein